MPCTIHDLKPIDKSTPIPLYYQLKTQFKDMIQSGSVDMIVNTPQRRRQAGSDGIKIRRMAVEHSILCLTSLDTAHAILTARERAKSEDLTPIDITTI